jgi:hypothetical protein
LLASVPATADFQIDVTPMDFRKNVDLVALIDLGVGEKGIVNLAALCTDGGGFLSTDSHNLEAVQNMAPTGWPCG